MLVHPSPPTALVITGSTSTEPVLSFTGPIILYSIFLYFFAHYKALLAEFPEKVNVSRRLPAVIHDDVTIL